MLYKQEYWRNEQQLLQTRSEEINKQLLQTRELKKLKVEAQSSLQTTI